ncbi:MAG: tRNA (5-methylaminomethyl-2-thiouridine)(34)-methyltransferase MnmD [Bacteroidota bacterium]
MPDVKIITTEDGSHSLFHPELNETYHSHHGALQESVHVFIDHGLKHAVDFFGRTKVSILEVGFGTGLNALLTVVAQPQLNIAIDYTTLEPYPLEQAVIEKLNYTDLDSLSQSKPLFERLHASTWNEWVGLRDKMRIKKSLSKLEDFDAKGEQYNVVYFDAFAPNKQAEMWDKELLTKVYYLMSSNSIFVTYCAKGQLKRDLKAIGFEVETLPGPPGKKEMVRAMKMG